MRSAQADEAESGGERQSAPSLAQLFFSHRQRLLEDRPEILESAFPGISAHILHGLRSKATDIGFSLLPHAHHATLLRQGKSGSPQRPEPPSREALLHWARALLLSHEPNAPEAQLNIFTRDFLGQIFIPLPDPFGSLALRVQSAAILEPPSAFILIRPLPSGWDAEAFKAFLEREAIEAGLPPGIPLPRKAKLSL